MDFSSPGELERDPRRGARALRRLPRRVLARARARPLPRGVRRRADARRLARRARSRRSTAAPGSALTAASVILEEINASGCNSGACHAQMYTMGTILRHGSDEQKQRYLPRIASGELRLQAFGVTEPTAGSDTTRIQTTATRDDGGYVVRGQKIWTSRAAALRPDAAARPHDAGRPGREEDRRALDVHRRHEARARGRDDDDPPDQDADEPRDDGDLLRRRRGARPTTLVGEEGQGLPLHPRRHERRARS